MNPPPKSVNSNGPQAETGLPPKAFFCRGWFAPIVHWQRWLAGKPALGFIVCGNG